VFPLSASGLHVMKSNTKSEKAKIDIVFNFIMAIKVLFVSYKTP